MFFSLTALWPLDTSVTGHVTRRSLHSFFAHSPANYEKIVLLCDAVKSNSLLMKMVETKELLYVPCAGKFFQNKIKAYFQS